MSQVHNTNVACCTIPPVESDYTPKGSITKYNDFEKCYITGTSSTRAIVCVFDIFGIKPQTQQGADILASTLNAKVYMPDFFYPDPPISSEHFPPKTDQEKKDLQDFFGGTAKPPKAAARLQAVATSLKGEGFTQLAAYGFCWGGKVTMLAGSTDSFDAISIIHPAMLSVGDAENLKVPLGLYPSKDEPIEECEKIMKEISTKSFASKNSYKLYPTMFHGWAAARANLNDADNLKEYSDLYSTVAGFFDGAWKQ